MRIAIGAALNKDAANVERAELVWIRAIGMGVAPPQIVRHDQNDIRLPQLLGTGRLSRGRKAYSGQKKAKRRDEQPGAAQE